MKGALAKTALIVGLFLIAAVGFWSSREAAVPDRRVPRVIRELNQAIAAGNVQQVDTILKSRPDLLNRDSDDGPPLHIAARYNQVAVIEYLLNHGADRKIRGPANCTALHWACWWGSKDAAERLIADGFAIEDRSDLFRSTPLIWVAEGSNHKQPDGARGDYEGTARVLIEHGASVDACNERGMSALSIASEDVAKVLTEHGASRNAHPSTQPSARAGAGQSV